MREFLFEYYTLLTKSFEILALVVGIIVYKKYKHTRIAYFIWFLGWIVFVETIGNYPTYLKNFGLFHFIEGTLIERNYWWFTLFWTSASTIFYSWLLSKQYVSVSLRRIIKYGSYLYILVLLLTVILDHKSLFHSDISHLRVLNVSLIILSSIFYFFDLLISDKLLNASSSIYFYIACIILIWWLVTLPLAFFEPYFNQADWGFITIKWTVMLTANILMYSAFAFALVWCEPEPEK